MTITIGWIIIPIIITIVCLFFVFRPLEYKESITSGMELIFRIFWLIPILFCWVVYLLIF